MRLARFSYFPKTDDQIRELLHTAIRCLHSAHWSMHASSAAREL